MALRLEAIIGLNSNAFERGMDRVKDSVAETAKSFVMGAVGVYGIEQAISKTVETAEELVNTGKNLSLTVEQLQVMRQAAKENGVEFQTMATALQRFNAIRENVLQGGKGSAEQMAALSRLGITRSELQNQNSGQSVMGQISNTARNSNAADIAKDLRDVFGKGGDALFGTLQTNFDELGKKMKDMGAIMDSTTAHQLKQFKDEMDLIGTILMSQLAPYLVQFAAEIYDLITKLGAAGVVLGTLVADWLHGRFKGALTDAREEEKNYMDDRKAAWDAMVGKANEENKPPPQAVIEKEAVKEKKDRIQSDSLVKVGNFLGSNRVAINNAARMEQAALNTASNTAKAVAILEQIAKENGLKKNDHGGWSKQSEIPVN